MFRICDSGDSANRKGFLLLKKIRSGGCTWSTFQVLLGWLIDTFNMTMFLHPYWENPFKDILVGILHSQKRFGVDKWHRVLGGIRSMDIALPGVRGLFSHMQEAIRHVEVERVVLTRGVHQDLSDFRWLAEDLSRHPTRLYGLVLLQPTVDGYHEASRYICGGLVLPVPNAIPSNPQLQPSSAATSMEPSGAHPIVWRVHFPVDILVSWDNLKYQVTNSDLELVVRMFRHTFMADYFDICE